MGVAGAGKSLQGRWLADELGLPWVSTGEFLRMLVTGERRRDMLSGKLLDDTEIIKMADKIFHMIDVDEQMILDGFPRTVEQANWLLAQHKAGLINVTKVIHLTADEDIVVERLLSRGRQDDTKAAIRQRFVEHKGVILPIISEFENSGISVQEVNGNGSPEEVRELVRKVVG